MNYTLQESMIRIQRALIYGSRAEAVNWAVRAANMAAGLKPEQIPPEIVYWNIVALYDAPTEEAVRFLKYYQNAKTQGNAYAELLAGLAKLYLDGQVRVGLDLMLAAVSHLGTSEARIAGLRNIVHVAVLHCQMEMGKKAVEQMRYLSNQVDANPNLLILAQAALLLLAGDPEAPELVLGDYQEVLHGQHKDPYARSLIERSLGEVEVLKAFRLPEGPCQKQHWLRARGHFQRARNLIDLCRLPRWADPTWPRADMYRALTHLHLLGAGAAVGAMNTGVDAFTAAPCVMNLDAAVVDLLLRLQVGGEEPADLRAAHTSVVEELNKIEGDALWMAATRESRVLLKVIDGRIDFVVRHREESLANALTHFKEVLRTEPSLTLRVRALRWMADAMREVPGLVAGAPGIEELADQLNEEREQSECPEGLLAEEDTLYA